MDKAKLSEVFDQFDVNKNGTVDAKELKAVVKTYYEIEGKTVSDEKLNEEVGVGPCQK